MGKIKVLPGEKDPKFVVLPFGGEAAVEDRMDEIWAEKAIKEHEKEKHHEYKTLDDLKELLAKKEAEEKSKK